MVVLEVLIEILHNALQYLVFKCYNMRRIKSCRKLHVKRLITDLYHAGSFLGHIHAVNTKASWMQATHGV